MNIKSLVWSVIIFAVISYAAVIADNSKVEIKGIYMSVSESEWQLELELKDKNVAEIIIESWYPGGYEDRKISKTTANWTQKGNIIVLSYDSIIDSLKYDSNLSLREIGRKGGMPGLYRIGSYKPNSKIGNVKLWNKEKLQKINESPFNAILPQIILSLLQDYGYTQYDKYYDKSKLIDPCFLFGYGHSGLGMDRYNSVICWARTKDINFKESYLIFLSRPNSDDDFSINEVIKWEGNIGGLSIFYDSLVTLDEFISVKDHSKRGPKNVNLKNQGIRSYYDGAEVIFYKYGDEWFFRERNYNNE